MSGLFQRIARRPADPPDGPSGPDDADAPTRTLAAQPSTDAPTGVQPAPAAPASAAPHDAPPGATGATDATAAVPDAAPRRPGFRERGRMRRRLRYLRRLRELQVRDLGGLVFDLRRFERKRDDLVAQKIDQMRACDDELQALELLLDERRDVRDVREPGIGGTCPRCFAIFGSTDRFCATCGAALGGAAQGPAQVGLAPPAAPTPPAGEPSAAAPTAPTGPATAPPAAPPTASTGPAAPPPATAPTGPPASPGGTGGPVP